VADVSILDLFWLILKILAALGLVSLLLGAVYLICKFAFKMLKSLPDVFTGRASTAVIVGWVLVIVGIISATMSLVGYFKDVK
jgi:hypothetical protein